jgi:hypothetical protein
MSHMSEFPLLTDHYPDRWLDVLGTRWCLVVAALPKSKWNWIISGIL